MCSMGQVSEGQCALLAETSTVIFPPKDSDTPPLASFPFFCVVVVFLLEFQDGCGFYLPKVK